MIKKIYIQCNYNATQMIDTMDKSKYGSDIDKKLEMLEDIKSELDAYQENQSKYEPATQKGLTSCVSDTANFSHCCNAY
jgi:hypothetical protein